MSEQNAKRISEQKGNTNSFPPAPPRAPIPSNPKPQPQQTPANSSMPKK